MRQSVILAVLLAAWPANAQAPEPIDRYVEEGRRALAERRWPDAAKAYEKLRELVPETPEVHAQLGMIYFQLRDFGWAVPALQRAEKLQPGMPNVEMLLAMCLSEVGRYEEALPGLRKGFTQASDGAQRRVAGLQLQRSLAGLGRDEDAVQVALELARLFPKDPEILYHAGRTFSSYAYTLTTRLADIAPTSTWMHQAAGEANESLANYDAALAEYRKVLELAPKRPGIHYRLGRVHLARARPPLAAADAEASAVREFEAELRVDPTNANAAYELGELRRKAGDLDAARALFARAVEHHPDFEPGLVGLARVMIARGQPASALPHLQKATRLAPDDEVAFFHLFQAQRALGHALEAAQAQAEFERLRARKREKERQGLLRRHEGTQQELEKEATSAKKPQP
jgi:tetratricopeptide (TPR) repeat protein